MCSASRSSGTLELVSEHLQSKYRFVMLLGIIVLLLGVCQASAAAVTAAGATASATCKCQANHQPVCGEDGTTYCNPCAARCAGVTVMHKGACSSDGSSKSQATSRQSRNLQALDDRNTSCACPASYEPVCSVQGVTRNNACTAVCYYKENIAYYGECSPNGPPKTSRPTASSAAGTGLRDIGLGLLNLLLATGACVCTVLLGKHT